MQPNGLSVAQTFQDGPEAVLGCRPDIKGCSRTDAGVHALGFMLNFHADTPFQATKLASTGGFLMSGNTTFLICSEDDKIDEIIEIIKDHSHKRKQCVPSAASYGVGRCV